MTGPQAGLKASTRAKLPVVPARLGARYEEADDPQGQRNEGHEPEEVDSETEAEEQRYEKERKQDCQHGGLLSPFRRYPNAAGRKPRRAGAEFEPSRSRARNRCDIVPGGSKRVSRSRRRRSRKRRLRRERLRLRRSRRPRDPMHSVGE